MKIQVRFITNVNNITQKHDSNDTLYICLPLKDTINPYSHFEDCKQAAQNGMNRIVSAPFETDGYIVMAYINGEECHYQRACFLPDKLNLFTTKYTTGDNVTVFPMMDINIALAVGFDILQPQYTRLAALRGVSLLVSSLWLDGDEYLMNGPWSVVQANCLPVACAQPGKGNLILPCVMTNDNSGFGRDSFFTDEITDAYRSFPVFDSLNPDLYNHYRKELLD